PTTFTRTPLSFGKALDRASLLRGDPLNCSTAADLHGGLDSVPDANLNGIRTVNAYEAFVAGIRVWDRVLKDSLDAGTNSSSCLRGNESRDYFNSIVTFSIVPVKRNGGL